MKVLFAVRNDGADAYFRAVAPASVLRYNNVEAEAGTAALSDVDEYDVLVIQRQCSLAAEVVMRDFQDEGKPVIYDVDDWLFSIPPSWPAYDDYFIRGSAAPSALLIVHERMLRRADLVTCTVPALAERLLAYNENVRVLPNCVMWADWDTVLPYERQVGRPVIGWFGMPYYWDTWKYIAEAVEQAVFDVDGWLTVLGYPEVAHAFSERLRSRTLTQPMCPWSHFHNMRRMIATFDVGIAWLEGTPFDLCKSPLKALQYGAAGVPVVASGAVYGDVLREPGCSGECAILADTPEALYHGIVSAIEHPKPAGLRAEKWRSWVWRHHTYETQWMRWLEVLTKVSGLCRFEKRIQEASCDPT
jgi:hypothetical protein